MSFLHVARATPDCVDGFSHRHLFHACGDAPAAAVGTGRVGVGVGCSLRDLGRA
jgi:L-aminopeptidase/D-esterase-like protein